MAWETPPLLHTSSTRMGILQAAARFTRKGAVHFQFGKRPKTRREYPLLLSPANAGAFFHISFPRHGIWLNYDNLTTSHHDVSVDDCKWPGFWGRRFQVGDWWFSQFLDASDAESTQRCRVVVLCCFSFSIRAFRIQVIPFKMWHSERFRELTCIHACIDA